MCIAELGRILICLLVCALFEARTAQAHPVSQGAMEIVIFPDRIEVQATVSMEEVLVAAAFSGRKETAQLEAVRGHGDYLRAHLRVMADGRSLGGRVVKVPEKAQSPLTYALEYRLTGGAPARIDVQQDVLREFEFAPGNPWEASYLVRIGEAGQSAVEGLLLTSKMPLRFDCEWGRAAGAPRLDQARMAAAFVRHGIMHILTGYDHLLFVGALVLAVVHLWDLVKVIGAFTLAHTITLTLTALDVFRLPGSIVEPMIAASIVFVAVQNVFWPKQSRGGSRLLVAFLFGLFHGLGFAGGLLEAMSGLRAAGALVAIMAFSAGVEIGHQLVVLPAFCALRLLRRVRAGAYRHDRLVQRYGSAVISLGGMIYLVAALR
jgi:hypothetical protein